MIWLRQSTARTVVIGPFVDSTDGATAETGLTIAQADIRLSKNGGAFAQTNNSAGATHMENGYYSVPLDTTDTGTLGVLRVAVNESGALPVWADFMCVPANVWDSMFGSDRLEVDAHEIEGGDATNAIRDALVDDATRIDASALNTLSGHDPGETIMGATDLGTGSGLTALASAADLATVDTVVDGIASDVAALNDLDAGDVQTAAAAALTAYDPPTKAELDAAVSPLATSTEVAKDATVAKEATVAALNDLDAAGVRSAVGLAAANLDTQLAGLPTDADVETACEAGLADYGAAKTTDIPSDYATAAAVTALNDLSAAEAQAAAAAALTAYDPPTRTEATSDKNEVLAAMPEGSDAPTAGEVADAVWDEALVDHAVAGSTGARLAAAAAAGDPWTAELPGDYESGTAGALLPSLQGALTALGAASVTVSNPVAESGTVTLHAGDDYDPADGRGLLFTVADETHALHLDEAGCVVRFKSPQVTWSAASVSTTPAGYLVMFSLTHEQTSALSITRQLYELEATQADGDIITLATGTLVVVRDIPAVG
jgi:acid phosphatase family membrane protein YuiD